MLQIESLDKQLNEQNASKDFYLQNSKYIQASRNGNLLYRISYTKRQDGSIAHFLNIFGIYSKQHANIEIKFRDNTSVQEIQLKTACQFQVSQLDSKNIVFYNENKVFAYLSQWEEQLLQQKTIYAQEITLPQNMDRKMYEKIGEEKKIIRVVFNENISASVISVVLNNGLYFVFNLAASLSDVCDFGSYDNLSDLQFGICKENIGEAKTVFLLSKKGDLAFKQVQNLQYTSDEYLRRLNEYKQGLTNSIYNQSETYQKQQPQEIEILNNIDQSDIQYSKVIKLKELENTHVFLLFSQNLIQVVFTNLDFVFGEQVEAFVIDLLVFASDQGDQVPQLIGNIGNTFYFCHQNNLYSCNFDWIKKLDKNIDNIEDQSLLDMKKKKSDLTCFYEMDKKQQVILDCLIIREQTLILLTTQGTYLTFNIRLTQKFIDSQEKFNILQKELKILEQNALDSKKDKQEIQQKENQGQKEIQQLKIEDLTPAQQQNKDEMDKHFQSLLQSRVNEIKKLLEEVRGKYYTFEKKISEISNTIEKGVDDVSSTYETEFDRFQKTQTKIFSSSVDIQKKIQEILEQENKDNKSEQDQTMRNYRLKQLADLKQGYSTLKQSLANIKQQQEKNKKSKEEYLNSKEYKKENYHLTEQEKKKFSVLMQNCINTYEVLNNLEFNLKSQEQQQQ